MKTFLAVGSLASLLSLSCCVARGARVRVPRGGRPIEELATGDEVICVDPLTGEQVAARLSAVRTARRECVRLVANEVELTLTSDHPVYCPQTGQWAPAGDWALGRRTHLLEVTPERARPMRVTEAFTYGGVHDVFDLTVAHPLHNFVANGVLVHNKTKPASACSAPDGGTQSEYSQCTCRGGEIGILLCSPDVARPFCQFCDYGKNGKSVDCYDCQAVPDAGQSDGG